MAVGSFEPRDVHNGKVVDAVGPMQSHGMDFELQVPADVQSSVLHGRRISVRHVLVVEMSSNSIDSSALAVELPVCIIDDGSKPRRMDPAV